jgi:uncharacterized protein (TIGR03086 family)
MDERQQRYADSLAAFGAKVHAVTSAQWTNRTPCTEWDVHALVNHVVYENLWAPELFAGRTVAEIGERFDGDQLRDDPADAWDRSAAAAAAAVTAEGAMDCTVHLSFGDVPGSEYAWQLFTDLVIHGWDLARGIGADDTIEPGFAELLFAELGPREAELKSWGLFGGTVIPSPDASVQTKLLAVMGRVQ